VRDKSWEIQTIRAKREENPEKVVAMRRRIKASAKRVGEAHPFPHSPLKVVRLLSQRLETCPAVAAAVGCFVVEHIAALAADLDDFSCYF